MALILPILRLWLLFINVYGTFKAIKPPIVSQRMARPSSRVLQLRKRELKSRLAMWVVWAVFFSLERLFDRTAAFVTPFYNELKCVALLFLLITRSHGAEAIFLHLIHPFIRPYVPAVDDILANLYSVYELLQLLLLIPWEYITEWWSRPWRWIWSFKKGFIFWDQSGTVPETQAAAMQQVVPEDEGNEIRNRLRPRTQSQKGTLQEAEQHAKIIFDQIDEAQDQVRIRTRSTRGQQLPVGKDQNENTRPSGSGSVGLRTRKRLLEQSAITEGSNPGSRNTRVHHLDPSTIAQLAKTSTSSSHDGAAPPRIGDISSRTNLPDSAYEIWIPPPQNDRSITPPSRRSPSPYRSPSPVYPPFPSAYPFTPRKSDYIPPPSHIVGPDETVQSRTRHTSMGEKSTHQTADRPNTQHFIRKHNDTSATSESRASDGLHSEDFFRIALGSTIHTDMDVDTETLSTVNGSSATEESTYDEISETRTTARKRRNTQETLSTSLKHNNKRIGDDMSESFKCSTRLRTNETGATAAAEVKKDEFGFTIQPGSGSKASPRRQAAATTRKKPLARAKPAVKSDGELLSDDTDTTESLKKKRKTKTPATDSQSIPNEKKGKASGIRTTIRADPTDVPVPARSSRVPTKQVVDPSSKPVKRKS